MALKKNSNPKPEEGNEPEPKIVRPYDDEVVDPFKGDDVELRDPWDESTPDERPVTPVKKEEPKDVAPPEGEHE